MFVLTTLAYPAVLLLLCAGAGLLLDRVSGGWLPAALLPAAGAATLIALSQLSTYVSGLAPATPWLMLALALCGLALGAPRLRALALRGTSLVWPLSAPLLAYVVALAPVLASGRATFSSFMALSDSAVHLLGADYLLHHGQQYSHLDVTNSYGQFVNDYYNSSYPSGADTLFGGSALLLGLPLNWAFQPFCAFMLACSAGPAWLLARTVGLWRGWAALAALAVTVPALVYGYELVGSVKEITTLPVLLALGVLATLHRRWLTGPARGSLPLAVVAAAGFSALGAGFALWLLVAVAVPGAVLVWHVLARRCRIRHAAALIAVALAAGLVCTVSTWTDLSGSVRVAKAIANTANPGNLHRPLLASQAVGVWLRGSYRQSPAGGALELTRILIAVALALCAVGVLSLLRARRFALAAWLALMLLAWLFVALVATTWVNGKEVMLTSPVVVLIAWAGVAALLRARRRLISWVAAPALAAALIGGVLASDFLQYRSSNLAPTARYDEMATVNSRFAGRGPTLVSDFDEYALYGLRSLDVGGPNFAYPPPALAAIAGGYGRPVALDRASPRALDGYRLIVTRRDPSASPPPAAYALLWQGTYYEVWGRRAGAAAALAHVALRGSPATRCSSLREVARKALARGAQAQLLAVARSAPLVDVPLSATAHPSSWGHERSGLVMSHAGVLEASLVIPQGGAWTLWLQGQIMPPVTLSVDGHRRASVAGQLAGNSLVPDTIRAVTLHLATGRHRLALRRAAPGVAPGSTGTAVLDAIFLAPAALPARTVSEVRLSRWRELCAGEYQWLELLSAA
jgi:hypothetical protein